MLVTNTSNSIAGKEGDFNFLIDSKEGSSSFKGIAIEMFAPLFFILFKLLFSWFLIRIMQVKRWPRSKKKGSPTVRIYTYLSLPAIWWSSCSSNPHSFSLSIYIDAIEFLRYLFNAFSIHTHTHTQWKIIVAIQKAPLNSLFERELDIQQSLLLISTLSFNGWHHMLANDAGLYRISWWVSLMSWGHLCFAFVLFFFCFFLLNRVCRVRSESAACNWKKETLGRWGSTGKTGPQHMFAFPSESRHRSVRYTKPAARSRNKRVESMHIIAYM